MSVPAVSLARSAARSPLRVARHAGHDLAYLLASLPLTLVGFALVAVGLPVGAALSPLLVGLVVLAGLSRVVGGLAWLQRRLAGRAPQDAGDVPRADPEPARSTRAARRGLRAVRTWREFGFFALAPLSALVPAAVLALLAVVVGRNLSYPVVEWNADLSHAWGGPTWIGAVALHFGAGVVALVLSPLVVSAFARAHRALVRRLLAGAGR